MPRGPREVCVLEAGSGRKSLWYRISNNAPPSPTGSKRVLELLCFVPTCLCIPCILKKGKPLCLSKATSVMPPGVTGTTKKRVPLGFQCVCVARPSVAFSSCKGMVLVSGFGTYSQLFLVGPRVAVGAYLRVQLGSHEMTNSTIGCYLDLKTVLKFFRK